MSQVIIAGDTSGSITLAAPAVAGSGVLTLPVATDTLVGKATTDTLTNKTVGTTLGVGGATPSASGSGITFPATQSASTNANTLDDYEEGTWTPNQGAGLTVVGAFSSTGGYSKIGNTVVVRGSVFGATSITVGAAGIITSNLPFTPNQDFAGAVVNANINGSSVVLATGGGIYASSTVAVSTGMFFTATYFV